MSRTFPKAGLIYLACVVLLCLMSKSVQAQGTFGNRAIGGTLRAGQRNLTSAPGGGALIDSVGDSAGTLSGDERFLRQNRQAGQFVGNSAASGSSAFGNASQFGGTGNGGFGTGGFGTGGFGTGGVGNQGFRGGATPGGFGTGGFGATRGGFGNTGFGGQFNRFQGNQFGGRGTTRRTGGIGAGFARRGETVYKTRLRVAFEVERAVSTETRSALVRRLRSSSRLQQIGPVDVDVNGRTVVLRGTVATADDRRLAEQLVLLEPGVSSVRNELLVVSRPQPGRTQTPPAELTQPGRSPGQNQPGQNQPGQVQTGQASSVSRSGGPTARRRRPLEAGSAAETASSGLAASSEELAPKVDPPEFPAVLPSAE